jgi:hypothetical protein
MIPLPDPIEAFTAGVSIAIARMALAVTIAFSGSALASCRISIG